MSRFERLPEFDKEFSRLSKKYPSLSEDLKKVERLVEIRPTGAGKNFTTIHHIEQTKIVKVHMACKSLRKRSMRLIYAYHENAITFVHIELYFKGDKENEDRGRINGYLRSLLSDGKK